MQAAEQEREATRSTLNRVRRALWYPGPTWLSGATAAFERRVAGRAGLRGRLGAAAATVAERWLAWVGGPAGIVLELLGVALLHGVVLLPAAPQLPALASIQGFLATLWQVSGAVVGLGLAVVVLVVERMHQAVQGPYVWERFLSRSGFYWSTAFLVGTVLAAGLGTLLLLPSPVEGPPPVPGLSNLLLLDSVLFTASLLLLLRLYARVFAFLRPGAIQRLVRESFGDAIRSAVRDLLITRVRRHLLEQACEQHRVRYSSLISADAPRGLVPVRLALQEEGRVADINLRELGKLGQMLAGGPRAVVVLGPGQRVTHYTNTCVLVPVRAYSDALVEQARRCFRIERHAADEEVDGFEEVVTTVTEQALGAIDAGRPQPLRGALDALRDGVRETLAAARAYGGAFRGEAAARDLFEAEAPPIERLFEAHRRILDAAVRSGDPDLAGHAAYWPYTLLRIGLEEGDLSVFRAALAVFPRLYQLSRDEELPPGSRSRLRDLVWRPLQQFSVVEIGVRFRGAGDEALVSALEPYALALLETYADLLRRAIDAGDRAFFGDALGGFLNAVHVGPEPREPRALATDEEVADIAAAERAGDTRQLRETRRAVRRRVLAWRDTLWLGLGAWMCEHVRAYLPTPDAPELQELQAFASPLGAQFADFSRVWQAFLGALEADEQDRLPVSRWEVEGRGPAGPPFLEQQTRADLARFFALVAVRYVPRVVLERRRELSRAGDAAAVRHLVTEALADVRGQWPVWRRLLGDAAPDEAVAERERALLDLLDALATEERESEHRHIAEQPMSPTRVGRLDKTIQAEWAQQAWLRRILEAAGVADRITDEAVPPDVTRLATVGLLDKRQVVDDPGPTRRIELGAGPGQEMAERENTLIYDALRRSARVGGTADRAVAAELAEMLRELTEEGYDADLILLSGGWPALEQVARSAVYARYAGPADARPPALRGTFDGVPVYQYRSDGPGEVLVVSLRRFGRLVQHLSAAETASEGLRVAIEDFSEETARRAAAGDRAWLSEAVRGLPDDELVAYLRERVRVRLEQTLELHINDPLAVRLLAVPPATSRDG